MRQNRKIESFDFDGAGSQIGIDHFFWSGLDQAFETNNIFRLQRTQHFTSADNLNYSGAISKIDEDNFAVITLGIDPTLEGYRLANFTDSISDEGSFHGDNYN